jgi:hypothetical protein
VAVDPIPTRSAGDLFEMPCKKSEEASTAKEFLDTDQKEFQNF